EAAIDVLVDGHALRCSKRHVFIGCNAESGLFNRIAEFGISVPSARLPLALYVAFGAETVGDDNLAVGGEDIFELFQTPAEIDILEAFREQADIERPLALEILELGFVDPGVGPELFGGYFGLKMARGDHFDGVALVEQHPCHLAGTAPNIEQTGRGRGDEGEELVDIALLGHAQLRDVGLFAWLPQAVLQPGAVGEGPGHVDVEVESFGLGFEFGHAALLIADFAAMYPKSSAKAKGVAGQNSAQSALIAALPLVA